MNNMDYLNKIAADNRPLKKKGVAGLGLNPTVIKLAVGGVILAILIIILGSVMGGSGNKERDLVDRINLRTANLITTIKGYNKQVKSSELRSLGNSLSAVVTEMNAEAITSLKNDFGSKSTNKPENETVKTEEDAHIAKLNETLENARLNGLLDRVYAREMAYQIAMLASLESETAERTKYDELRSALLANKANLDNLYDQFESL